MPRKKSSTKKASTATDLQKRLKKMKQAWEEAKSQSPGGGEFPGPDGRYRTRLVEAELRTSANDNVYVHWGFEVIDGEYEGEKIVGRKMIETDQGFVFLQQDLRRLGVDIDAVDLSDLESVLKDVLDTKPIVELAVKTKGEFFNVYIQTVLDDEEEDGDEEDDEEEDGDEEDGDEEDDDDYEEQTLKVGSRVYVEEFGEDFPGVLKKITDRASDDGFHVTFDDGDKGKFKAADVHLLEDDDEEEDDEDGDEEPGEIKKGSNVAWNDGENTGVVKSIKGSAAQVLDDDTQKKVKVPLKKLEALVH